MKTPEQAAEEWALPRCGGSDYQQWTADKDSFIAGAEWAVKNDPRVLALIEALEWYHMNWGTNSTETKTKGYYVSKDAIAAFDKKLGVR